MQASKAIPIRTLESESKFRRIMKELCILNIYQPNLLQCIGGGGDGTTGSSSLQFCILLS